MPVTCLVKQHADNAVERETKFQDNKIGQQPDDEPDPPPITLTGCSQDTSRTSQDYKKIAKKNIGS